MCGIVGYVGYRNAQEFLLEGLRRLEYRGYDSAGIGTITPAGHIAVAKTPGRIEVLAKEVTQFPTTSAIGIGHTRWATHGPATQVNAHPHLDDSQSVAIVHNGVIENFRALKDELESRGHTFTSATDSEVVAHLIHDCRLELEQEPSSAREPRSAHDTLLAAVLKALTQLRGTYGLVVLFRDHPDVMVAARLGSPLVIGLGQGEHYVASDPSPLVGYADKIVYLADHQVALLTAKSVRVTHREQGVVQPHIQALDMESGESELDGFPHYMLKEIFEQPEALENTMRGRLSDEDATAVFGGLNLAPHELHRINRIILTACGTSWHSSLVGEYTIEHLARLPVEVEYASELRYRNPPVDHGALLFAITQSGETADTLAALREMKRKGHPTLAICNVVGSTIAQEANGGIYLHAGPEIGVASTKAYTCQCLALTLLALYFGRLHHLSYTAGREVIDAIRALPERVRDALQANDQVRQIAGKYCHFSNFLYLGRQFNFPTALEGALKLKEISYIHAEGYPAAEMKHGPIALVDKDTPSVFIMPHGFVYDKVMANLEEVKARGGPVIAIVAQEDRHVESLADDVIRIPHVEDYLQPLVAIIPLQLLAYHIAVLRGCDVDKPRNLAKSVTVE
ncbi:MAG: glutamine--fructose-6-phosphate transaminase (isomerizing) [Pirellulaceae bacterium]|jgi:glucosamine--fructose-6-phosphate aminotransferase (isomerizing)|nr:glutamine--fructose-6-phosphate transaminase (isomerizing) [Pirellulaceae bacterium]